MKRLYGLIIYTALMLVGLGATAQVTVNSLEELQPYLKESNTHVKMAPGTYTITVEDIENDKYTSTTHVGGAHVKVLLLFQGNNSTYDFTDVTLKIQTGVFKAFGGYEVREIQVIGNDNVLKNLTMIDDGSVDDAPAKRAQNICLDGARNRIEGFHVTIKGSYPYGYGDVFGKGGKSVIGHRKHSACLVRGESNHVKNCTFIHKSYGHCIFMQAASNPIIEGCYVEGEVRSTDDMLLEEGTGSPADKVDFMTVWGYRLPAGYMLSLGEAGIRAYNAGRTIIDSVEYQRGTSNPTVKNCTIKYMRTGVTLAHASGTKYVDGCTAIACENGFSIGSGTVTNCSADVVYGPVYKSTYDSDKNYNAEITILPPSEEYYNGAGVVAYVGGSGHNLVFKGNPEDANPDLKIQFGGFLKNIRLLEGSNPSQNNHSPTNVTIQNLTGYPVELTSDSDNISGQSCGTITDNGQNNSVKLVSCDTACINEVGVELPTLATSGINYQLYQGDWSTLPDLQDEEPVASGLVADLSHSAADSMAAFAVVFNGYVHAPATGRYTFYINSDDAAALTIGDEEVILSESASSLAEVSGEICLEAGYHQLEVVQVQKNGDATFEVSYESNALAKTALTVYGIPFEDIPNLAYMRETAQSSTAHGGVSSRAVDGNTDGAYSKNSVTHTSDQRNAWWKVYLDKDYTLGQIKIYNRTDACCADRLANFNVSIMKANGEITFSQNIEALDGASLTLDAQGSKGSLVKVELNESGQLTLAEVEVFAGEAPSDGGAYQMVKRSAKFYAIDGGSYDASAGFSVQLHKVSNHENRTWIELPRPGGYYAYQKANTNLCLDGGTGTESGTDLTLEPCSEEAPGQQWVKMVRGDDYYTLLRKDSELVIDAGDGRLNGDNVYLDYLNLASENQQWRFDNADTTDLESDFIILNTSALSVQVYPNPVVGTLTIDQSSATLSSWKIQNLGGKVLLEKPLPQHSKQVAIDLSWLAPGVYMITLQGPETMESFKVIKK
ncbi:RICIN domain-containing protein [Marinoscillum furvescens]|uniref:Putative secreted protein (Por secretion system target) n=1 Tax=Marinoscillum furvescens DSM 4134 TaxID=1122208 RepID=A0A3D9L6M2_MARFU|nr:RICIN domain-containing protein [Marinoscillum furvescens]REE01998.1 putative secreted protein (Por secretion system target) [Marinoscillum furvescens DSM 4134]